MKIKNYSLHEDVIQEPSIEAIDDAINITVLTSNISALIKDEWEAIDGYNQAIVTLSANGASDELINTLNDIIDEEYVHIGQLEKSLQMLIPEAEENMEKGEDEAEEDSAEDVQIEEPAEEDSVEEPDVDYPEDDIPMEVADAINFDKEEEEEE